MLLILTFGISQAQDKSKDFLVLKGSYLGQKKPGMIPELFAPGIVSTGASEYSAAFTPDGKEFYFALSGPPYDVIMFMKQNDEGWTRPQVAPFSGRYTDYDINLSPDGKKIFFTSQRPRDGSGKPIRDNDLWVVRRTDKGWSEPVNLGSPVNTKMRENYASVSKNGTLYFHRWDREGDGSCDIFRAEYINGSYSEPERMGKEINSDKLEWDPFIAGDESYIIFGSMGRPDSHGLCDLYISFRNSGGSWTKAINMGNKINSPGHEFCPSVSPDGKYFFFMSSLIIHKPYSEKQLSYEEKIKFLNSPGNESRDIYWVDAKIFETLRPEKQKTEKSTDQFSILSEEYLGQKKPGLIPEVFAPGIVCTGSSEFSSVFAPDGKEFYYTLSGVPFSTILCMKQENNQWTKPQVAPFSGRHRDCDMNFSPDGKRLFFCSNRPLKGTGPPKEDSDIWLVERTVQGWSEPENLGSLINSNKNEYYPTFTRNGTLYFSSSREGGKGGGDIYRSKFVNGKFTKPENLGDAINTRFGEGDVFIAPDENYIIVTCYGRSDGIGSGDLYISARKKDGLWSELKNMGNTINSEANEHCPMLSHDGRFLFFTSRRSSLKSYSGKSITYEEKMKTINSHGNGMADIYWVDANVISKFLKNIE